MSCLIYKPYWEPNHWLVVFKNMCCISFVKCVWCVCVRTHVRTHVPFGPHGPVCVYVCVCVWEAEEGEREAGRERTDADTFTHRYLLEEKKRKLKIIPLHLMRPHWTSPESKSESQRQDSESSLSQNPVHLSGSDSTWRLLPLNLKDISRG